MSKGAWQAAAQPDDYCEPDRAQRELLRRARWREAMFMASLHQQGAEPKRPLCGIQRGGSVLSKRVSQAAAPGDDYCEADRAKRDSPPAPIASAIRNLNRRRKALGAGLRLVSVDSFGSFRLRRQPTGLTFPLLTPKGTLRRVRNDETKRR